MRFSIPELSSVWYELRWAWLQSRPTRKKVHTHWTLKFRLHAASTCYQSKIVPTNVDTETLIRRWSSVVQTIRRDWDWVQSHVLSFILKPVAAIEAHNCHIVIWPSSGSTVSDATAAVRACRPATSSNTSALIASTMSDVSSASAAVVDCRPRRSTSSTSRAVSYARTAALARRTTRRYADKMAVSEMSSYTVCVTWFFDLIKFL